MSPWVNEFAFKRVSAQNPNPAYPIPNIKGNCLWSLMDASKSSILPNFFKINTVVIGIKFEKIKQVKNIKYGFPIDEIPLKIRTANTPSEIIIG